MSDSILICQNGISQSKCNQSSGKVQQQKISKYPFHNQESQKSSQKEENLTKDVPESAIDLDGAKSDPPVPTANSLEEDTGEEKPVSAKDVPTTSKETKKSVLKEKSGTRMSQKAAELETNEKKKELRKEIEASEKPMKEGNTLVDSNVR